MVYMLMVMALCFILGLIGVASNPSPYYGVMGLVLASVGGCGGLVGLGGTFTGLVVFLIYLGGMLVVFAYSVALAAEPHPETWGEYSIIVYVLGYVMVVAVFGGLLVDLVLFYGLGLEGVDWAGLGEVRFDFSGMGVLFVLGGFLLLLCGVGLLLALFVVFEVVRGRICGALRVP